MGLFRRKKNKLSTEFIDPELDIELEYSRRKKETVNDAAFTDIENMQFIRTQCEQAAESSKYIEELKNEKMIVQSYILDLQKLSQLPDSEKKYLKKKSQEITGLEHKRDDLKDRQSLISKKRMQMFDKYEEDFPKALTQMQNDEKYCQAVKHDMKLLESERNVLKYDMKSYQNRVGFVKKLSIVLLVLLVVVFTVFFASGQLNGESGRTLFFVVLFLSLILIAIVFLVQRSSVYGFRISEKKLHRSITLLNKVKIKYVNIVNSVDYQHEKYGVKNSYQLGREYEAYLTEKRAIQRYQQSMAEYNDAVGDIMSRLKKYNLYDDAVWEKQFTAFADENEMQDIRDRLDVRLSKLNIQIEYNIDKINFSKNQIMDFVKKHPDKSREIMEIIDSYDVDV